LPDCDCAIYLTASRASPPEAAYEKVNAAVKAFKSDEVRVSAKRIDTTLRGNPGAETDAMLDALDDDRVAMVVPCFPSSGRINVGGYLLVRGVPLHKTALAQDPKTPVFTSSCAQLYKEQSKYPSESILLGDVMKGGEFISVKLRMLSAKGVRSVIFDAITEDDIDVIADSVIQSGIKFIAVDPGPFTASLCRKLIPVSAQKNESAKKILVVVGSVNAVARAQVDVFLASQKSHNVFIDTPEFLEGDKRRKKEIERVVQEIAGNCDDNSVCGVIGHGIVQEFRTMFDPYTEKYHASMEEISKTVNVSIAEICYRILALGKGFEGIYCCGSDATVALCRGLQISGMRILDEVMPLASYGEVVGGKFSGLKMVTIGSMTGDADAIASCVRYLKEKLGI
jgi:uncharacterized protein YgbK (DUF1537 family)